MNCATASVFGFQGGLRLFRIMRSWPRALAGEVMLRQGVDGSLVALVADLPAYEACSSLQVDASCRHQVSYGGDRKVVGVVGHGNVLENITSLHRQILVRGGDNVNTLANAFFSLLQLCQLCRIRLGMWKCRFHCLQLLIEVLFVFS